MLGILNHPWEFLVLLIVLLGLVGAVVAGVFWWRRLGRQIATQRAQVAEAMAGEPRERYALEKDLIDVQHNGRVHIVTTMAQVAGGVALVAGLAFTWGNLQMAREAQVSERFAKAVEQLGALVEGAPALEKLEPVTDRVPARGTPVSGTSDYGPHMELRVGGIYALERLARDYPSEHWPVMEVLTEYVRRNAPGLERTRDEGACSQWIERGTDHERSAARADERRRTRADLQAVLTVLSRRTAANDRPGWELDLGGTNLWGLNLNRVVSLERAWLQDVDLEWADLSRARLRNAWLVCGHLSDSILKGSDLQNANLTDADLSAADLSCHGQGRGQECTNLTGAVLKGANLTGAVLKGAKLDGANLSGVRGLTCEQLKEVQFNSSTIWPQGLQCP